MATTVHICTGKIGSSQKTFILKKIHIISIKIFKKAGIINSIFICKMQKKYFFSGDEENGYSSCDRGGCNVRFGLDYIIRYILVLN